MKALKEFTYRLKDSFPLEIDAVKLYGSKARGQAIKKSDVDVFILVKNRTKSLDNKVIDLVCDILDEYDVFLETVTMTSRDYKTALKSQYPFTLNIERDAILL